MLFNNIMLCVARRDAVKREVVPLKLPNAQAQPRSEMQVSREGDPKNAKRCSEEGSGTAQATCGSGTATF